MKTRYSRHLPFVLATVIILILVGIKIYALKPVTAATPIRTFSEILASDTIYVCFDYGSSGIEVHQGEFQGFYYEFVSAFAQNKGLSMQPIVENSLDKRLSLLNNGSCDLIATPTLITEELKERLLFTQPILQEKLVLVQRSLESDSLHHINNLFDCGGKHIYLPVNSPFAQRIDNLSDEIADTIFIEADNLYNSEQLIAMVAKGDIDYTVCDERTAKANIHLFDNVDITIPIGFTQNYAWVMPKQATELCDSLNLWIEQYKKQASFRKLQKKYAL